MEQSIVISFQVAAFLGAIVGLIASVVVWAVNGRMNRFERALAEQAERTDRAVADLKDQMDRDKADLKDQMVRDKADLKDQMDRAVADLKDQMIRDKAEVMERIKQTDERVKQSDERSEERWRTADTRFDKQDSRSEERWRAADTRSEKQDSRSEERYREIHVALREIHAALRDISYRVGRLEGAGGAPAGPAPRAGRHSPRQADEPAAALGSEPDPALVALGDDGSMVPVAGVRAEPGLAAGQAHQAVPGREQAGQQADKTELEPRAEEPPDTAR